ncbi:MAG: hypothetical protein ACXW27_15075 [Allosphingosinicella sp.]
MEPIKPADRQTALSTGGTEKELAEYDKLIAERLAADPFAKPSKDEVRAAKEREIRIADLHHKLFSVV